MKKIFLSFICVLVFILTACEKSDPKEVIPDSDKYFDYQIKDAVSFTESEGKIWVSTADSPEVLCYDSMGKEMDKINMGEKEDGCYPVLSEDYQGEKVVIHSEKPLQEGEEVYLIP